MSKQQINNWLQQFANPKGAAIKKYMFDVLKNDFSKHQDVIERISFSLQTDKDMQAFGSLIATVYQKAYAKAVDDYRGQLKNLGYDVKVVEKEVE